MTSLPYQKQPLDEVIVRASDKGFLPDFREVWRLRDLMLILTIRDIKLRYKQTVLGLLWVVLQPLLAAVILATVFGYFARLNSDGVPYVIFVFSALLPWNLFAGILARAGNSILKDSALISKVYFPRIILPISSSLAVLVDYIVTLVVLIVLMLIYGIMPSPNIIFIPFLSIVVMIIGIGVSLFFSAASVYYRDFVHVLPFVTQIWFYAAPVVYSITLVPAHLWHWYALNPWVGLINAFRWALLGGQFPLESFSVAVFGSIVIFFIGAAVFQRIERNFVDAV
jgi:lipopolysaccharide transport system permease protein